LPLISNLSVVENISLILEYHGGIPTKKAIDIALVRLSLIGMEEIANKREPHISHRERFATMFLRASIVPCEVLIDRPFLILETDKDADFIYEVLTKTADFYKTVAVFDFSWNKERYGELNV
jgi:ABC-type lipoprotein export system ATPase subunit